MDTRKRSWVKSITWRLAGIGILGAITYGITRDAAQTTGITVFFHAVRFALYYFHERLWDRTNWGRIAAHPSGGFHTRPDLTAEDRGKIRRFLADHGYLVRQNESGFSGILSAQANGRSAIANRT